ncbi:MAG: amidohydrolase family protein [Acidobacteria bacterium]|nr:amidohydrolase family protein [Acidobacteriota bacterium]
MKRFLRYSLSCLFFALLGIPLIPSDARGQEQGWLVVEGGTLIDGRGGPPLPDALIIIRGDRIETMSRKGQASYPAGAQVLRADGKFILPGLMDAHVHYQWWMPELMLAHGVTTIFDIGGSGQWGRAQREAIERGKVPGPRMFATFESLLAAWPGLRVVGAEGPMTREKALEVVRRNVAAKADLFNLRRGLSLEVFQAAVAEAHRAGLPVVAQAIGPEVYGKEAVLAGADVLEHAAGINISIAKDPAKWKGWGEDEAHSLDPTPFADMDEQKAEEMIRLLVQRNVFLEPDLIAEGRGLQKRRGDFELEDYQLYENPRLAYVPEDRRLKELGVYREFDDLEPAAREMRLKGFQNFMRFIGQYVRAGGKVLVGDDTSSWAVPGAGVHHELQILVEDVGLTPMQAIQAATRNSAEAFRVLDRVGTLEAGKFADLLIVAADPLENVRNLQKIEWVVKDGKVADRTFHPWFKNPLRNSYRGMVEGRDWVAALKQATAQGTRTAAGLNDRTYSFGQPCPGIDSITPAMVTAGDPTVTLTIRGVNFTSKSLAYLDDQPLVTRRLSETELQATIDAGLIARPETFAITVKNPGLLSQPQWGGTSNRAYFLVNFRY